MREAVETAITMAEDCEREDLDANVMLTMALTRCLEILGEAAAKIGQETRDAYPSLPYVQIIAMRNRLIHAYFDVNLDVVWTTIREDLPALLPVLNEAIDGLEE